MLTVAKPVSRLNFTTVAEPSATSGQVVFPANGDGSQPLVTKIQWISQTIEITSPRLFDRKTGLTNESRTATKRIIERLFQSEAVESVEVDRDRQTLLIRIAKSYVTTAYLLEQITGLLTAARQPARDAKNSALILWEEAPVSSFQVSREGRLLTTWRIENESPTQIVLSNRCLKENQDLCQMAEYLADELPDIQSAKVHKRDGTLLLRFAPGTTVERSKIVQALEHVSSDSRQLALLSGYPKAPYPMVFATLGVATVAQWGLPVLWPAAALMVTVVNWRMIVKSFRDLRAGTLGLPMLTTLIIAGTAMSGAFFASALMSVLSRYWQNQYAKMLTQARRAWLGNLALPTGSVNVQLPNGATVREEICCLKAGDVIEVHQGETIPADGRAFSGSAIIDYSYGREHLSSTHQALDHRVYAGGKVESGVVRIKVDRLGSQTRLAQMRHEVLVGSGTLRADSALNDHGQKFADKTVLPTLALAGLGLATGGVGTAVAVMRPDYATGVGLGHGLERLRLASEAYHEGFLIRDPDALTTAQSIDIWINEQPANRLPVLPGQIVAELIGPDRIDLLHGDERLTLQGFSPVRNDVDRMRLILLLRERGLKVGWTGNAERYPNTAGFADMSLSTSSEVDRRLNPSSILSLNQGQSDWNTVFEIFRHEKQEQEKVRKLALIPNVAAVAGAFTMGFTSLATVLLTNAGIWTVHNRSNRKSGSLRIIRHDKQPV